MSEQSGEWLRNERESRGWDRPEMARQLIAAAKSKAGGHMPGVKSLTHNIYRWESGDGVSQRYILAYCAAFGIDPAVFPRRETPATPYYGVGPLTEDEVLTAAHEASERAGQAERRGIGDTALEQLRADVARLSRDYMTAEPVPVFREMLRVRGRMHDALDRPLWPRDTTEIYFLLSRINDLLGCVAADLGHPTAAEEFTRAGWAFAVVSGSPETPGRPPRPADSGRYR